MSASLAFHAKPSSSVGRSVLAIVAAFLANALLSLATDQLLHVLDVYPPWGEPMHDPRLNALALTYRIVYGVAAGVIVARLAPRAPMRHAAILGTIGFGFATLGAVVAVTQYDLGPAWYPIALAVTAFPSIWLGAAWHGRHRYAR
jgi:hypothetical protein